MGNNHRKFSNYLILSGFQIKYTLLVFFLTLMACLTSSYFISSWSLNRYMKLANRLTPLSQIDSIQKHSHITLNLLQTLQRYDQERIKPLLWWLSIISSFLAAVMIFFLTHRIAGPLFRIYIYFKEGKWYKHPLIIRNEDDLQSVVSEINLTRDQRNYKISKIQQSLEHLVGKIPQDKADSLIGKLEQMRPQ